MNCKNCKYWKNEQAELEYNKFSGICVSPELRFNTTTGRSATVLDRSNPSGKYHRTHSLENVSKEIPIGQVESSRYCLVTEETFGCINFTKITK